MIASRSIACESAGGNRAPAATRGADPSALEAGSRLIQNIGGSRLTPASARSTPSLALQALQRGIVFRPHVAEDQIGRAALELQDLRVHVRDDLKRDAVQVWRRLRPASSRRQ